MPYANARSGQHDEQGDVDQQAKNGPPAWEIDRRQIFAPPGAQLLHELLPIELGRGASSRKKKAVLGISAVRAEKMHVITIASMCSDRQPISVF